MMGIKEIWRGNVEAMEVSRQRFRGHLASSEVGVAQLHVSVQRTWAISSVVLMLVARVFKSATTALIASLIPRRRSMGLIPAATDLAPSERMALVSTVAVVVPAKARKLAWVPIHDKFLRHSYKTKLIVWSNQFLLRASKPVVCHKQAPLQLICKSSGGKKFDVWANLPESPEFQELCMQIKPTEWHWEDKSHERAIIGSSPNDSSLLFFKAIGRETNHLLPHR